MEQVSIIIYDLDRKTRKFSTGTLRGYHKVDRIVWEQDEVYIQDGNRSVTFFKVPYKAIRQKVEHAEQES